jgi:hypothetical protein
MFSTKILRSEKFSEKTDNLKLTFFCQKGRKNDLAVALAWLAY